jgi:hypothetical protein
MISGENMISALYGADVLDEEPSRGVRFSFKIERGDKSYDR